MGLIILEVSGVKVLDYDASADFNTDGIRTGTSYKWAVKFENGTTGGTPTYTIEYSMDGVNWHSLENTIDSPIDTGFIKSYLGAPHFRVAYKANGATGTLSLRYNSNYEVINTHG